MKFSSVYLFCQFLLILRRRKITHELDLNADNFSKTKFESNDLIYFQTQIVLPTEDWPTVFDNSLPAAKICIFPPIVSADLLNWDIVEKSEGYKKYSIYRKNIKYMWFFYEHTACT
jgi:hypothetical protein